MAYDLDGEWVSELAERHLTVGRLRSILAVLPAATKVLVHAGWDFPVFDGQDGPHVDSEGLILYLDYADSATMVNKDWYNAVCAVAKTVNRVVEPS